MFTFEGVSLRPVEETDLEVLRSLRNEQSTWTNLTDIQLITAEQQKQWFQSIGTSSTRMYFVACSEKHAFWEWSEWTKLIQLIEVREWDVTFFRNFGEEGTDRKSLTLSLNIVLIT